MADAGNESTDQSGGPGEVVETIKNEGQKVVDQAKAGVQTLTSEQQQTAAAFLLDVASAIHKGASELNEKGHPSSASLIAWTGDEIGSLARQLNRRSPGEILNEIENVARQKPALAAGAAFLIGFGILRFMKSTSGRAAHSQFGR